MRMVLKKTDLGQAEIRSKAQALDMRERRVLILMDGARDLSQVEAILGASVEGIAKRLLHLGLVAGAKPQKNQAHGGGSVEFKDSLVGKTPATNFESFDNYLPTQSEGWRHGFYPAVSDSAFSPAFSPVFVPSRPASIYGDNLTLLPKTPRLEEPARQTLSPRGILLGKMYLADLVERMMGKDDTFLRHKIQQIKDEMQLLDVCVEIMEHIKGLTSPNMLASIEKRFMECIGKK